jgi:uncharacterized protein YuzE
MTKGEITMTYSPTADALSIWLVPGATSVATREIAQDVFADFDEQGRFLGIEVLNASGQYDRAVLEQLPRPGA